MKQLCFPLLTSSYVVFSAASVLIATGVHANVVDNCKRVSPAVVTIYAGTEIGSGSILTQDGVVITNHHVLEDVIRSRGKKTIYVNLPNGGHYTAKLLSQDKPNDFSNSHFETFVLKSEPLKACALNFMNGRMGIPAIDSCSK
ncbi:MAG TPA: serine protease [Leptolyngbyaceae cyanobacterium M33_DOE_097]|uniref:Serine protease n=1 Tax=Oscillatoriales cyanobacterium SpSt-418 TaxID=2282169 RepID=A0A7C3PMJ9_9CYAN|nr:serine protease [Leptolyngbyaceae cyanobacterium M33_DOE_097]